MIKRKFVHAETTRHGGVVWYFRRGKEARIRLPPPDHREFAQAYLLALNNIPAQDYRSLLNAESINVKQLVERYMKKAVPHARRRAAASGVPFDISLEWGMKQVEEAGFRCALTGIPFYADHPHASSKHPFGPSLDRVVPKLGYTTTNTRIVCLAVNVMLMDWGTEVFEKIANSYRYRRQKQNLYSLTSKISPAPKTNHNKIKRLRQAKR